MLREIQTGTKLELEIYNEKKENTDIVFTNMFEEYLDNGTVLVNAPIYERNLYPVRIESLIDVYVFIEKDLYMFESKVLDRTVKKGIPFLLLEPLSAIKHVQRRNYFRLEYSLPLRYKKANYKDYKNEENREYRGEYEEEYYKTTTKNISGGGVCFFTNEEIKIQELLECHIKLGKKTSIQLLGRVVRVEKIGHTHEFRYELGLNFEDIEEKDREMIIRFIFEQQRKFRSKGLL